MDGVSLLRLVGFALVLAGTGARIQAQGAWDVRAFGAAGDGATLDTEAINRAIESAAAAGGGTVFFPAGTYASHSIHLRSHVTLHLAPGSTILAADPPAAGQPGGYDAPEPNAGDSYQDFGHSHFRNSLIWGEGLENVGITGPGRIYGQGLSRGNSRIALPVGAMLETPLDAPADVLRADGPFPIRPRPDLKSGPFGHPNARDWLEDGVGNKAIALSNCRGVVLRDFTVLHGGHFAILAAGVGNLTIDNVTIDTNRDGIDIDACNNVRVSNCAVNSPWDDGICLKASYALGASRLCENVTISNCIVSGYDEGTLLDGSRRRTGRYEGGAMGRIKLGTEATGGFRTIAISNCVFDACRGLALEQVDGGVLEDVVISNLTMRDTTNAPIFIRLGERLRAPDGAAVGSVRRIVISNVTASGVSPEHGILILGTPGHAIEDLSLNNIRIEYAGGGTAADARRVLPELEGGYPDPVKYGRVPAWGLFARHVRNLRLVDLDLRVASVDLRPAVVLDDVAEVDLVRVTTNAAPGVAAVVLHDVTSIRARDAAGLGDFSR